MIPSVKLAAHKTLSLFPQPSGTSDGDCSQVYSHSMELPCPHVPSMPFNRPLFQKPSRGRWTDTLCSSCSGARETFYQLDSGEITPDWQIPKLWTSVQAFERWVCKLKRRALKRKPAGATLEPLEMERRTLAWGIFGTIEAIILWGRMWRPFKPSYKKERISAISLYDTAELERCFGNPSVNGQTYL